MPSNPTKATAASAAELLASAQERLHTLSERYGQVRLDSEISLAAHAQLAQIEALLAIGLLLSPTT